MPSSTPPATSSTAPQRRRGGARLRPQSRRLRDPAVSPALCVTPASDLAFFDSVSDTRGLTASPSSARLRHSVRRVDSGPPRRLLPRVDSGPPRRLLPPRRLRSAASTPVRRVDYFRRADSGPPRRLRSASSTTSAALTPVRRVDYFRASTPVRRVDYFRASTPVRRVDYLRALTPVRRDNKIALAAPDALTGAAPHRPQHIRLGRT